MTSRSLLALAWRENRFARRRLFLFLSAISLGVGALVAVQGFAENLARGVRQEARGLLGADLRLESRQPFGGATRALLDSLRAEGVEVAGRVSFASMAFLSRTGSTRLVQVRAPEPGYPFYGAIETRPENAWASLHDGRNAVVDPALLTALDARLGDSVSLGDTRFRIIALLDRVPGDADIASAFAPRMFIPAAHVLATGLVEFGSRVDHEAFVRLPEPGAPDRLIAENRQLLRTERVRSETAEEEQQELEDAFGRLTAYLGLVGVLALLLGGIGVASAMAAYMSRKNDTVAVLRCLGATARQVLAVYLLQASLMGLAGAVVGVVIGVGVQWALPGLFAGLLPVDVRVTPSVRAIVIGLMVGVWTAGIFAMLPLLAVRRVPPLGALRRDVEPLEITGRDWPRIGALAALGVSAFLLVWLQAGELGVAAGLMVGVAVALAVLWVLSAAFTAWLQRAPRSRLAYVVRQGIANLHRPRNQTRTVTVALGFGVFLLASLLLTQHNLLLPLRTGDAGARPNLLMWDVQDDQIEPLTGLIESRSHPVVARAPIVPMRIAAINGREVRPWTEEEADERSSDPDRRNPSGWAARREYRSTFRGGLTASERVVAGEMWSGWEVDAAQVSLERDIAEELGVGIGDRLTWDVQGVMVSTTVTSIREVDWARFEPNFFAVFPPTALEGAPRSWVLLTRAGTEAERGALQRSIVERFPNVAAIDLTRVQAALDHVIGRVSAVIRFLGGFSIATGFVVLLGAVAAGRAQRVRESVLLKTLGATRRQVAGILSTEYLLLGALATVIGTALAGLAGWALAWAVFDVDFEIRLGPLAELGAAVILISAVVGLWASREVFGSTPLEGMREE